MEGGSRHSREATQSHLPRPFPSIKPEPGAPQGTGRTGQGTPREPFSFLKWQEPRPSQSRWGLALQETQAWEPPLPSKASAASVPPRDPGSRVSCPLWQLETQSPDSGPG